jgi:hypothetical protein
VSFCAKYHALSKVPQTVRGAGGHPPCSNLPLRDPALVSGRRVRTSLSFGIQQRLGEVRSAQKLVLPARSSAALSPGTDPARALNASRPWDSLEFRGARLLAAS